MTDVTLSAVFPSLKHAESAAAKLQALRVEQVVIDQYDRSHAVMDTEASTELTDEQATSASDVVTLTANVGEHIHPQTLRLIEQCGGQPLG